MKKTRNQTNKYINVLIHSLIFRTDIVYFNVHHIGFSTIAVSVAVDSVFNAEKQ